MNVMKYIKECFEEHGKILTDRLRSEGFTNNQLIDFLPEAASCIAISSKNKHSSYVISNLLLEESSDLLSPNNISQIAKKRGLSSDLVMSGFKVISPFFLKSFLNNK